MDIEIHQGDCLDVLHSVPDDRVDLVYLDPPFFTQREHRLMANDRTTEFSFNDKWVSASEYTAFLDARLREMWRVLKPSGSLFFHCDRTASHIARFLLDDIFGSGNFRSEIIWHYKRWSTDPGDLVLDPFCGSGTSLVASKLLGRKGIGVDISAEACELSRKRVDEPFRTESQLIKSGEDSYRNADTEALSLLKDIPHIPVHRNQGIDAFLKATWGGVPIPVRVQKSDETLAEAVSALYKAGLGKHAKRMILIAVQDVPTLWSHVTLPSEIIVVDTASLTIRRLIDEVGTDGDGAKAQPHRAAPPVRSFAAGDRR